MTTSKTRYNDYIYDPLFIVSGEKDYYKAAMVAKMASAKFAICPIFPSMFSDLPNHPRQQLIMRRTQQLVPEYVERTESTTGIATAATTAIDPLGVDRHKFFHSPIVVRTPQSEIPTLPLVQPPPSPSMKPQQKIKKSTKKIQTQYRESSAQTTPWQPDYIVMCDDDPELLMLDFLKWGSGLPAGMHEVRLIERARMKRAWEQALPPITDAASLEKRRRLIEAMERDEWTFREQEIQDIQNLRLELLEKMLLELHEKSKCRAEMKLKSFCKMKQEEKDVKIKALRHKTERELRKLTLKQRGINTKYHPVNVIDEHLDKKSELYAPLVRHGEHPKRWHQVIDEHLKKYRAQFVGVEEISTLPRWLDQATKIKDCVCTKLPGTRLCMRETKWTMPVLRQLHEELKNLRRQTEKHHHCTLLEEITPDQSELCTPEVDAVDDWDEGIHQAAVLIQSVLRGRASQMLIFEGRDRCRELIQELRSTHSLQEEDRTKKFKERLEVKSQQREHKLCLKNTQILQETLNKLSGNIVGTLLDFLNKELRRLLDERRVHAMCLVFERERHSREAAEAGRRQTELRRRLEHDEIFKQVVKVHQDTVDLYLQDIITEGMKFASEDEARRYVEAIAKKIDDDAYESLNNSNYQENEEIVANLIHNFLLPEVEKQLIRDRIKKKQKVYLKTVHDTIYGNIQELPKPEPKTTKSKVNASNVITPPATEADILSSTTPIGSARKIQQGEILQRAVCISGFGDINLPETKTISNVELAYEDSQSPFSNQQCSPLGSSMQREKDEFTDASAFDDETNLPLEMLDTSAENVDLAPDAQETQN